MNRDINDIMRNSVEVYLTTRDGKQHLRLHGWLKRHDDAIVKSEIISDNDDYFGTFMIFITRKLLKKLKEDHLETGLYCDLEVVSMTQQKFMRDMTADYKPDLKEHEIVKRIQNFMLNFQIKDKDDIAKFVKQANETSLALFRKNKEFIDDYIETKEMSAKEKIRDLNLMIEAFEQDERYEDCAFIVSIRDKLKKHNMKQKIRGNE